MIHIFENIKHVPFIVVVKNVGIMNRKFFQLPVKVHIRSIDSLNRIFFQDIPIGFSTRQHANNDARIVEFKFTNIITGSAKQTFYIQYQVNIITGKQSIFLKFIDSGNIKVFEFYRGIREIADKTHINAFKIDFCVQHFIQFGFCFLHDFIPQ